MTGAFEDLRGKVAVVTGAGSGFGRQFALSLAQAGSRVICIDLDAGGLAETAKVLDSEGCKAETHIGDVANTAAMDAVFAQSPADILINNAGIATAPARTHELSEHDWDRLLQVNLKGVFVCTRAALPGMLRRKSGAIINMSSVLALRGYYPGSASTTVSYAAAKGAVIAMTRQIAAEYAGDSIRANVICPGWHTGTNLGRERKGKLTPDETARFEEQIVRRTPLGRRGTPQELAGLVLYLASSASSFVTGQIFGHDGGWSAV